MARNTLMEQHLQKLTKAAVGNPGQESNQHQYRCCRAYEPGLDGSAVSGCFIEFHTVLFDLGQWEICTQLIRALEELFMVHVNSLPCVRRRRPVERYTGTFQY